MPKGKVTDRDRGYKRLMKTVVAPVPGLRMGVYGAKAAVTYADGISTGEVAEIHEFGRGNVPERSWFRSYLDSNKNRIEQMVVRVGRAVAQGKMTAAQGLNLLGLQMVGEIKQGIVAGIAPALAESTLERKGGKTTPLIETGQFLGSIDHEVTAPGARVA